MFASCITRVQLYVNACNGWPQFALQHHWLLPINCYFLQLYSAAGRGILAVSSAIEESDLYLYLINSRVQFNLKNPIFSGNEFLCSASFTSWSCEHDLSRRSDNNVYLFLHH